MKTGGAIRGFVSRWLMRFEASSQIFRIALLGVTAVSTLTSALIDLGYGWLAPYVLTAGLVGSFGFAWVYVEFGFFNRKNRERMDRGDNFSGPGMAMGMTLQGRQRAVIAEAFVEDYSPGEIKSRMDEETAGLLRQFRDGIEIDEVFDEGELPEVRNGSEELDGVRS